jgi:hypothetical protein
MTDRDRDPYLCDHGLPIPGACYSCDPPRDDYTVEEQHAMTRPPADPPATPCESCGSTESCYHDLVDDPGEPATPPVDDDDNLSCASCGTGEDECEGLMDDLGERCCKTCHHIGKGEPATPPGEAATAKAIKHLRNIDRIATESIERLDELKAVVNGERPAAGAGDEVQRWDVGQHMLGRECENVPSCDGGWVLYEDHAHALAAERTARVAAEGALAQAVVLLRDAALDDVASETYRRIQSFLAAGNATTGGTT